MVSCFDLLLVQLLLLKLSSATGYGPSTARLLAGSCCPGELRLRALCAKGAKLTELSAVTHCVNFVVSSCDTELLLSVGWQTKVNDCTVRLRCVLRHGIRLLWPSLIGR